MTPRVSVVTTVYNGEAYADRAIPGILAQTFADFEWIIVDDGSQDRTPAILEHIWRAPGDARRKRRLLFTLWDECAEAGASDVVTTARAVRGAILAFIRRRLPRGSRAAYSDAELDALNAARTSRERFDPYWQESATSAQQSP